MVRTPGALLILVRIGIDWCMQYWHNLLKKIPLQILAQSVLLGLKIRDFQISLYTFNVGEEV